MLRRLIISMFCTKLKTVLAFSNKSIHAAIDLSVLKKVHNKLALRQAAR